MSVMTGPPMTRTPRPAWPLSSVLPPMGALATAPRTVRMHVRDTFKEWGLHELVDDGELIASELVTNVVRRAQHPVTGRPVYVNGRLPVLQFGLFSDRTAVLISVWDQFADPPVPKVATANDEAGRGLMMVGRISASLDWLPTEGGKVVRAFLQAAALCTAGASPPLTPCHGIVPRGRLPGWLTPVPPLSRSCWPARTRGMSPWCSGASRGPCPSGLRRSSAFGPAAA
jgi:anti-sigma regulatory factor (Ser/Thr protein kinase)